MKLSASQLEAVTHGIGPLLVSAGPGGGKSSCLVARYELLVKRHGIRPEEIIVTSYTRKSAAVLATMISRVVGRSVKGLPIGTFHSFCGQVLRDYASAFGDLAHRQVLNADRAERLIESCSADLFKGFIDEGLVDAVMALKDRLVTPEEALRNARGDRRNPEAAQRIAKVYGEYQRRLDSTASMDFADMVAFVVRGLQGDEILKRTLHKRYRFLLVDEYQDINYAQNALMQLLVGDEHNINAFGDEDQNIYGFRGSDPAFFTGFADNWAGAKVVRLEQNYRSTQEIVAASQAVISKNRQRLGKVMQAQRGPGGQAHAVAYGDDQQEAASVAALCRQWISQGVAPNDIAILVRVAHHASPLERALVNSNVPFRLIGAPAFWSLREVRIALSLLEEKTGCGQLTDGPPFNRPKMKLDLGTGTDFLSWGVSITKAMQATKVRGSSQQLQAWRSAMVSLRREIREAVTPEKLREKIRMATVRVDDAKAVLIGTCHSAKGLEFSRVVVVGCDEGIFPHAKNPDTEEERRVFYVACSRARDQLVLTHAAARVGNESDVSPFLLETGIPLNDPQALERLFAR